MSSNARNHWADADYGIHEARLYIGDAKECATVLLKINPKGVQKLKIATSFVLLGRPAELHLG
jgi:hypothetical protein